MQIAKTLTWTRRAASVALGVAATTIMALSGDVAAQPAELPSRDVELDVDSGVLFNHGKEPAVVWSTRIDIDEAQWIRLRFSDLTLAAHDEPFESSVLRVTSLDDFADQHLNYVTARQWQNSTAYFNGDSLLLELIATPSDQPNRIAVSLATIGILDGLVEPSSICGPTDDRLPSEYRRTARVMPIICTGFLIDDPFRQFMTAGHCADSPSGIQVMEFNVPLSNQEGSPVHPGPEDQYPVDPSSVQFQYAGIGHDWAYFGCYPNSETGLTAYMAQGEFYVRADEAPPVQGQTIRITGYGSVRDPIPREWNVAQKTHTGPYDTLSQYNVKYVTDTSGGNSGSAVHNEDDDEVIGVHTHAGCTSSGGANNGTAIHHPQLQSAFANPRGVCEPFAVEVGTLIGGQNSFAQTTDATPGATVAFIYSLSGVGVTPVNQLGVEIGLAAPTLAGIDEANLSGLARLDFFVPAVASGRDIWMQAAEIGRASAVSSQRIQ